MKATDLLDKPILVIDDEWFMRSLVVRLLQEIGYNQVLQAESGIEALLALRNTAVPIAAIVLDLEMPQISGFAFLSHLRTAPDVRNNDIPVVVLTGHSNRINLIKAAQFGIHGFLVKPVSRALLERELTKALMGRVIDPSAIGSLSEEKKP